jgi:hypothetical protein
LRDSFFTDRSFKGQSSFGIDASMGGQDFGNMENYDEDEDDSNDVRGGGFFNDLDFFTWDLIIKNTPKLPQLELLLHKNQIKNKKFFTLYNDY